MPDLVIIDGGKGQLHAAEEVFREAGIEGVLVSDGRQVVRTDAQGRYQLAASDAAVVSIISEFSLDSMSLV